MVNEMGELEYKMWGTSATLNDENSTYDYEYISVVPQSDIYLFSFPSCVL